MVFDRTEHEPEEYDPEEDLRDPESDSLTIPRVSTEDAGSTLRADLRSERTDSEDGLSAGETDVPPELLKTFWAIVVVLNAAILAFSIGALLAFFEGADTRSLGLLVGGVVLFGFAVKRYRDYMERRDDEDDA
ncbi:DUF7322 domain-containing protein [Halosolutus gelatinilyticus]|uniref:DUF7322 domain-containing protein n=1 Tax=Halosolutus gelatinilyticus TaxID=2931975 RepID=UPI001FF6440E|nr:hypothetical protein [Halosolutus gelatinilyticus]